MDEQIQTIRLSPRVPLDARQSPVVDLLGDTTKPSGTVASARTNC